MTAPRFHSWFMAACVVAGLSACAHESANMVDHEKTSYQLVTVSTPGVTGANCFVQSGMASYTVSGSPGKVMVRRAPDPLDVTCFKGSHMVGNTVVKPTVAPKEAKSIFNSRQDCESCTYPENVRVVMALKSSSVEKNNVRQWR
jgi:hypothetical protein